MHYPTQQWWYIYSQSIPYVYTKVVQPTVGWGIWLIVSTRVLLLYHIPKCTCTNRIVYICIPTACSCIYQSCSNQLLYSIYTRRLYHIQIQNPYWPTVAEMSTPSSIPYTYTKSITHPNSNAIYIYIYIHHLYRRYIPNLIVLCRLYIPSTIYS